MSVVAGFGSWNVRNHGRKITRVACFRVRCMCVASLTSWHFEHALWGVRDGGGHAYGRVTALLQSAGRMAKRLWFSQLTLDSRVILRSAFFPFTGWLCLKAARVISSLVPALCLPLLAVPGKATFNQRALLSISAQLWVQIKINSQWLFQFKILKKRGKNPKTPRLGAFLFLCKRAWRNEFDCCLLQWLTYKTAF